MEEYSLFSSKVWSTKLNIEKEGLISRIKEFADENPSQRFSNVNGYQGHRFDDEELVFDPTAASSSSGGALPRALFPPREDLAKSKAISM